MPDAALESKLTDWSHALIDQNRSRVAIAPYAAEKGYWFGGGNLIGGPEGELYLVGRYRNQGDSRTGLAAGTRGLELAIFRSADGADSFQKVVSLNKEQLSSPGAPVLSIEGTALRYRKSGWELFVSTEKSGVDYPPGLESFLKPGTGIWSIDRLQADTIEQLASASVEPLLSSGEPESVHVKDPFLYREQLFFCSHPFSWTCSNTGYQTLGDTSPAVFDFFPRGNVWDVAMSRGTCVIDVPRIGAFRDLDVQLMFYDGGECVRDLDQHAQSVQRPRGYSCEELGGVAYFLNQDWSAPRRLSRHAPMFVSPFGTGCSRYVDCCQIGDNWIATWQQAQADGSQPLVMNRVPASEINALLQ